MGVARMRRKCTSEYLSSYSSDSSEPQQRVLWFPKLKNKTNQNVRRTQNGMQTLTNETNGMPMNITLQAHVQKYFFPSVLWFDSPFSLLSYIHFLFLRNISIFRYSFWSRLGGLPSFKIISLLTFTFFLIYS